MCFSRLHFLLYLLLISQIESVFSLAALEAKLVAYVKDPSTAGYALDVSSVPKISRAQAAQEAARELQKLLLCLLIDYCS